MTRLGEGLEILLYDPEGFLYQYNPHVFGKNLSQCPETILIFFYIKVFMLKPFFAFPAASWWLKTLGICAERLWTEGDFPYDFLS